MKATSSRFVLVVAAMLSVSLGVPRDLRADGRFGSACFIQSTPFYQKLLSAGIFNIPVIRQADHAWPIQLLFRMGHSFHYAADRKMWDEWQSADETSRSYGGDCEDKAIWLYTQLRRNGYDKSSLVIGKYGPVNPRFHMWVTTVDTSGETLLLDPTIQRRPWNIEAFPKNLYRPMYILSGEDCVSL